MKTRAEAGGVGLGRREAGDGLPSLAGRMCFVEGRRRSTRVVLDLDGDVVSSMASADIIRHLEVRIWEKASNSILHEYVLSSRLKR